MQGENTPQSSSPVDSTLVSYLESHRNESRWRVANNLYRDENIML